MGIVQRGFVTLLGKVAGIGPSINGLSLNRDVDNFERKVRPLIPMGLAMREFLLTFLINIVKCLVLEYRARGVKII